MANLFGDKNVKCHICNNTTFRKHKLYMLITRNNSFKEEEVGQEYTCSKCGSVMTTNKTI